MWCMTQLPAAVHLLMLLTIGEEVKKHPEPASSTSHNVMLLYYTVHVQCSIVHVKWYTIECCFYTAHNSLATSILMHRPVSSRPNVIWHFVCVDGGRGEAACTPNTVSKFHGRQSPKIHGTAENLGEGGVYLLPYLHKHYIASKIAPPLPVSKLS